jgi:hypothetical protein
MKAGQVGLTLIVPKPKDFWDALGPFSKAEPFYFWGLSRLSFRFFRVFP